MEQGRSQPPSLPEPAGRIIGWPRAAWQNRPEAAAAAARLQETSRRTHARALAPGPTVNGVRRWHTGLTRLGPAPGLSLKNAVTAYDPPESRTSHGIQPRLSSNVYQYTYSADFKSQSTLLYFIYLASLYVPEIFFPLGAEMQTISFSSDDVRSRYKEHSFQYFSEILYGLHDSGTSSASDKVLFKDAISQSFEPGNELEREGLSPQELRMQATTAVKRMCSILQRFLPCKSRLRIEKQTREN